MHDILVKQCLPHFCRIFFCYGNHRKIGGIFFDQANKFKPAESFIVNIDNNQINKNLFKNFYMVNKVFWMDSLTKCFLKVGFQILCIIQNIKKIKIAKN